MEEYIDVDYTGIMSQIKKLEPSMQYAACSKFLDLVRPYFCRYILPPENNSFYRVRTHDVGTGKYFFTNISELSYRPDFFNITRFGRCNCPYESVFYCSDSSLLSLIEVSLICGDGNRKDVNYYTLSIWKIMKPINITPIFQGKEVLNSNTRLLDITKNCLKTIDAFNNYSKKENLKEFHRIIGKEFVNPFSTKSNTYLFSSAVANYLLNNEKNSAESVDGLVYPTCIDLENISNIGLNYAFNPVIIGFGNKIEFVGAYRSKMEKKGNIYYETERRKFMKANRYTGEISW